MIYKPILIFALFLLTVTGSAQSDEGTDTSDPGHTIPLNGTQSSNSTADSQPFSGGPIHPDHPKPFSGSTLPSASVIPKSNQTIPPYGSQPTPSNSTLGSQPPFSSSSVPEEHPKPLPFSGALPTASASPVPNLNQTMPLNVSQPEPTGSFQTLPGGLVERDLPFSGSVLPTVSASAISMPPNGSAPGNSTEGSQPPLSGGPVQKEHHDHKPFSSGTLPTPSAVPPNGAQPAPGNSTHGTENPQPLPSDSVKQDPNNSTYSKLYFSLNKYSSSYSY